MFSSEQEYTQVSSENESECLSYASEDSFVSALGDFAPYDESSFEPIANIEFLMSLYIICEWGEGMVLEPCLNNIFIFVNQISPPHS